MAGREQIRREVTARQQENAGSLENVQTSALTDDLDAILGDIDAVLEENAEEFVRGFVQKGGQ